LLITQLLVPARTSIMVERALQLSIFVAGLLLATGCAGDETDGVTVTVDMRCGTTASCPAGFECTAETEHFPPTTLCESRDPAAICPPGFDTRAGYGQTFCTPQPRGRTSRAEASSTVRGRSSHIEAASGRVRSAGRALDRHD
jgi:hypothetical protein